MSDARVVHVPACVESAILIREVQLEVGLNPEGALFSSNSASAHVLATDSLGPECDRVLLHRIDLKLADRRGRTTPISDGVSRRAELQGKLRHSDRVSLVAEVLCHPIITLIP